MSYVKEVRKRQPRSRYLLGGLCAGGVIANEMASQLLHAGEIVEFVALLDAATPRASKRRGRIANERLARLKEAFADACKREHSIICQVCSFVVAVRTALPSRRKAKKRQTFMSVQERSDSSLGKHSRAKPSKKDGGRIA